MVGGFLLLRNMFGAAGRTPVGLRRLKQTMPEETRHPRTEYRKIISRMKKDKKSQNEIARTIGFIQGTISKKLKRHSGQKGYLPKRAPANALERKKPNQPQKSVITESWLTRSSRGWKRSAVPSRSAVDRLLPANGCPFKIRPFRVGQLDFWASLMRRL